MMAWRSEYDDLIRQAREMIAARHKPGWHHVGCALRTRSGKTFAAVHLEAYVGRVAVCAEAVGIGMAAAAGDTDLEAIVAVSRDGKIVSPCGMCRELIADYAPECLVIVGEGEAVPISALLPRKYVRD